MKLEVKCGLCDNNLLRRKTKTDTYFCNIKCKGDWQIQQREKIGFTKEWLIDQYFILKKDLPTIGKEIGRDAKTIWWWAKSYGLTLNKRGSSYEKNLIFDGSTFKGKTHTQETKNKIREVRLKDGHVPYLVNGKHWLSGGGSKHPNWKGGVTPDRQSVYSSAEWSDAVKLVWKRDNATCQHCQLHQSKSRTTKFHIHHIKSFMYKETRCDVNNLVLLCPPCHKFIHSKKNKLKLFIK